MEVVEKKEMVHKDVYESGEKEYASKGVAGMVGLEAEQHQCHPHQPLPESGCTVRPVRRVWSVSDCREQSGIPWHMGYSSGWHSRHRGRFAQ